MPNPALSFDEGGIAPYNPEAPWYRSQFESLARHLKFRLDTPLCEIPKNVLKQILHGTEDEISIRYENRDGTGQFNYKKQYPGVLADLKRRYLETQSEGVKQWLEKYMSQKPCEACGGRRLRPEALAVQIGGKNIH
ncbi:MAG: excinuclease ABC subunit UvrA, partial [Spirochaetaceae bacterium]|nr:excinuclease ABC subunit UvrA [Spirochaetaceae bacterium]